MSRNTLTYHTINAGPRALAISAFILLLLFAVQPVSAQMVSGEKMPGYADTFGVTLNQTKYPYAAHVISSSIPSNILWPGDQPTLQFQLVNQQQTPIDQTGTLEIISYGTKGAPGDVWTPHVYKIADCGSASINCDVPTGSVEDFSAALTIPARFGAYAVVLDLGPLGKQFLTTYARTFQSDPQSIQYPHFCLDGTLPLSVLQRLGVHAVRYAVTYVPSTDPGYAKFYADQTATLQSFQSAGIAVLFMVGVGALQGPTQPLGVGRPLLDDTDTMLPGKFDAAWLPSYDSDFQSFCKKFATDFGWPKGPINAFSLWNEPWEGVSISGWGADMIRYRDLYNCMYAGVDQARTQSGVQVLVGGGDSTSNAMDKFFSDGKLDYLPKFDFVSEHYQGLNSDATVKMWADRTGPRGRVKIWDTESWVANSDDRVAAVVAGERAAGFDRAMGVYPGNIAQATSFTHIVPGGQNQRVTAISAWSAAASVGAATHFIGERPFDRLLFPNGLPWVTVFDGLPSSSGTANPEDGTVVVVGDLGDEFGSNSLPLRTARGLAELSHKQDLQKQLDALAPTDTVQRAAFQAQLDTPEILSGASLTLPDDGGKYSLYDFYGNPVTPVGGKIIVPLDNRGFFLRGDGTPGSFHALLAAIQQSDITGIEPLAIVAHDFTAPLDTHPALHLTVTNVLNKPVTGHLSVVSSGLQAGVLPPFTVQPNETRELNLPIVSFQSAADNTYPVSIVFHGGSSGDAALSDNLHVNYIIKKTITVDGKLDDWSGAYPQNIITSGAGGPSLTEKAWQPFETFDSSIKSGVASAYLAYDANNFYFAARIADSSPDPGTIRFANRDDDAYFYPAVSYSYDPDKVIQKKDVITDLKSQEPRALQSPSGDSGRINAGWFSTVKKFEVDLNLTDGKKHQVALYFLDNDFTQSGRTNQTVQVFDAQTGALLYSRKIFHFYLGKFIVLDLKGDLKLVFTKLGPLSAALNALFFDPTTSLDVSGTNTAALVKEDDSTQGNWKGVYGSQGYQIVGIPASYPSYATVTIPEHVEKNPLTWPADVRRYSYRKRPELPFGDYPYHDNIQIAFNVLPQANKPWYPYPKGTMMGFIGYKDTDYEYALNQVSPQYGGGTEIWRVAVPGMPDKDFYPRQPKSPEDGAVTGGKLVITQNGATRIVEASIPWIELPDVKKRLDAGETIKFTYRVNSAGGGPTMELAKDRSVSKLNASFHPAWFEHWANELEFGFQH